MKVMGRVLGRSGFMHALLAAMAIGAVGVPLALAQQAQEPSYPVPAGAAPPPPPRPDHLRTAVIERVSGRVTFRELGDDRHRRLREPTAVVLPTIVDARNGRVRVIVERNRRGDLDRAVFYSGKFSLDQEPEPPMLATLRMIGGSFKETCKAKASRLPADSRGPRRVRRLWGDGKGRFRTRGRYSAATVRGTKWLVEDRCNGTVTRVDRGEVEVEDFTVDETPQRPVASPQQPTTDGGGGGQAPAAAPAPQAESAPQRRRRVRVKRGRTYVARPAG